MDKNRKNDFFQDVKFEASQIEKNKEIPEGKQGKSKKHGSSISLNEADDRVLDSHWKRWKL